MPVRGEQRRLDREPDHLLARAHHAGGAVPLLEAAARAVDVARVQSRLRAQGVYLRTETESRAIQTDSLAADAKVT